MKLLIVQGPGYYGVNIRIVTEEQISKMKVDLDSEPAFHPINHIEHWQHNDGTMVIVCDVPDADHSTGFDTGWWDKGEALIDRLLKGDLS